MKIKEILLMRDYYRDQVELLHDHYRSGPVPEHVVKRAQIYRRNFQAYHKQVLALSKKEK